MFTRIYKCNYFKVLKFRFRMLTGHGYVVITVPADALAPNGARASAGTVLTNNCNLCLARKDFVYHFGSVQHDRRDITVWRETSTVTILRVNNELAVCECKTNSGSKLGHHTRTRCLPCIVFTCLSNGIMYTEWYACNKAQTLHTLTWLKQTYRHFDEILIKREIVEMELSVQELMTILSKWRQLPFQCIHEFWM